MTKNKDQILNDLEAIAPEINTNNKLYFVEMYITGTYDMRYNTSKNDFQWRAKGSSEWMEFNEDTLFIEMLRKNITISKNTLKSLINSTKCKVISLALDHIYPQSQTI
jgi:hypothetical protein